MSVQDERLLDVYRRLDAMHAWRGWHWWPDAEPFEVAVGAILVQNTAWTNVERALDRLRSARALNEAAMAALSDAELQEAIRPSGQYRQKALKLRAFLSLCQGEGGLRGLLTHEPATLRGELLGTWGIGEETADSIVLYAARHPAFVIDAYTRRLFGRLGLGPSESAPYHRWQTFFESGLDAGSPAARRDLWARYHALVVMHCKHLCRKSKPRCTACGLAPVCPAAKLG